MDAHENEYAAAAAGMAETYGGPALPSVGDFVSGTTAGKAWSGHVLSCDERRLSVEIAGAWILVPTSDLGKF